MKRSIYFIAVMFFFVSCQSKQAKLIKEYEERIDENTIIDLNLKVKELNQVGLSLAKDSFDYYDGSIINMADMLKNRYEQKLSESQFELKMKQINYKYANDPELKAGYKRSMDLSEALINIQQGILDKIKNKDYRKITDEMDVLLDKRDAFKNQDSIVGNIWECTYSIVNPVMNNAKQTIQAKYLFSPNDKMLIRKIN